VVRSLSSGAKEYSLDAGTSFHPAKAWNRSTLELEDVSLIGKSSDDLVILQSNGTGILINGEKKSAKELLGTPAEDWTEFHLDDINSDGMIVGTALHSPEGQTPQRKVVALLKMDIDIHQPGKVAERITGGFGTYDLPPEIPEAEQQDPARCPILVNDDNDDLDLIVSGSGASLAVADPYPQDNDDDVLKLRFYQAGTDDLSDPAIMNYLNMGQVRDDDDVVMITLRKFDAINEGKIRLTTSSNEDVQIFKYVEDDPTLDREEFSDLVVDLSNPGTTSPLKDLPNEDVSFYIEGMGENSDLKVYMILEDANNNELARQKVHLQVTQTRELSLSVLPHGSLSDLTIGRSLTRLFQGANRVREDSDGLDANEDNAAPVIFRLSDLDPKDTLSAHADWAQVGTSLGEQKAILSYLNSDLVDTNIYLTDSISGGGGFAFETFAPGHFVISDDAPDTTIPHEWLHAFANAGHLDECVDGNIMINEQQNPCPNGAKSGSKTSLKNVLDLQTY